MVGANGPVRGPHPVRASGKSVKDDSSPVRGPRPIRASGYFLFLVHWASGQEKEISLYYSVGILLTHPAPSGSSATERLVHRRLVSRQPRLVLHLSLVARQPRRQPLIGAQRGV